MFYNTAAKAFVWLGISITLQLRTYWLPTYSLHVGIYETQRLEMYNRRERLTVDLP